MTGGGQVMQAAWQIRVVGWARGKAKGGEVDGCVGVSTGASS